MEVSPLSFLYCETMYLSPPLSPSLSAGTSIELPLVWLAVPNY
jgi:hypothetical protein